MSELRVLSKAFLLISFISTGCCSATGPAHQLINSCVALDLFPCFEDEDGDRINETRFRRILVGMTESQVVAILGRECDFGLDAGPLTDAQCTWNGKKGSITVEFSGLGGVIANSFTPSDKHAIR